MAVGACAITGGRCCEASDSIQHKAAIHLHHYWAARVPL